MEERKKPSARFAIVFMLLLAGISAGIYVGFSRFQRGMAGERKEASARNIVVIAKALTAYAAKHDGLYPERIGLLTRDELPDDTVFIHWAWPDRAGYIYSPGVRSDDAPDQTLLVYENVPERKRKLGIQALLASGKIVTLEEAEFTDRVKKQEAAWKQTGRIWLPEEMRSKNAP